MVLYLENFPKYYADFYLSNFKFVYKKLYATGKSLNVGESKII